MARFLQILADGKRKLASTIATSLGAASADRIPATNASGVLDPSLLNAGTTGASKVLMTDAQGRIDVSAMPAGFGQDVNVVQASEALAGGDLVNLHTVSGAARVRKADATSGTEREAHGYVTAAVAAGAQATVFADGTNTGATGLAPGGLVYLDIVAGKATSTPPAEPHMMHIVGVAISATSYDYQPQDAVIRS